MCKCSRHHFLICLGKMVHLNMQYNELVPLSAAIGIYDSIGNWRTLDSAGMHRNDENWKFFAFNFASAMTATFSSPCFILSRAASDTHIAKAVFKRVKAPALCCSSIRGCLQ